MVKIANISALKASLSEYLAGVKAGEEVVVTERGRPVAKIVPYRPGPEDISDLVRSGEVRLGVGRLPADFWTSERPTDPDDGLMRSLLEERDAGR
jgi:prevent-host-death family protein